MRQVMYFFVIYVDNINYFFKFFKYNINDCFCVLLNLIVFFIIDTFICRRFVKKI